MLESDLVKLTQAQVDACFEGKTDQWQVLDALYRAVYGEDWDRLNDPSIHRMDGWPTVSATTAKYILTKYVAFDKEHHPDLLPGGMWALGKGFSVDKSMPDWRVRPAPIV